MSRSDDEFKRQMDEAIRRSMMDSRPKVDRDPRAVGQSPVAKAVLSSQEVIEQITNYNQRLEEQAYRLKQSLSASEQEHAHLSSLLSTSESNLRNEQLENDGLKQCLAHVEKRLQDQSRMLVDADARLQEQQQSLDIADERVVELEQNLADANGRIDDLQRQLELSQMNERLMEARILYLSSESQKLLLQQQEGTDERMKDSWERISRLEQDKRKFQEEETKVRDELEATKVALAELQVVCARPNVVRNEKFFMALVFLIAVVTAIIAKRF
jgi:chromosome segregation ATPase